MLAFLLLTLGLIVRFNTHVLYPNFTPVTAVALFSGVYLPRKYALILPIALMVLSDIFIGLHDTIAFTWGSFLLIALIGLWLKDHKSPTNILLFSGFSAVLFFLITNFGVWTTGTLYPRTIDGLWNCYIAGLPFLRNTLFSSIFYSVLLFGAYEVLAVTIRKTRFARVLLTT